MREKATLTINQRTVIEAIQDYLDKRLTPKMKVLMFTPSKSSGYGETWTYSVELEEIVIEGKVDA